MCGETCQILKCTHERVVAVTVSLMCGSSIDTRNIYFFSPCSGIANCPQGLKLIASDPVQNTITFRWKAYKVKRKYGSLVGYECKVYFDNGTVHTELLPALATKYTISLQREVKPSLPKAISIAALTKIAITDHTPPVKISHPG